MDSRPTKGGEVQQQREQHPQDRSGSNGSEIQDGKACAAALVNACLASDDENLQNYVLDWIATHGGCEKPALS